MTQLNDEHFELHDQNKAERYERQKIKFLEDRIKTLETAIESHAKILARFQMTEGDNSWVILSGVMDQVATNLTRKIEYEVLRVARF
jgi:hypothetical protein